MPKLTITQGLPGSGKSTWARKQNAIVLTSDDLRYDLYKKRGYLGPSRETIIRDLIVSRATSLLKQGYNVIICDTNLNPNVVTAWRKFAEYQQVEFAIKSFTHVPLSTCIARDSIRPTELRIGGEKIQKMYEKWKQSASGARVQLK